MTGASASGSASGTSGPSGRSRLVTAAKFLVGGVLVAVVLLAVDLDAVGDVIVGTPIQSLGLALLLFFTSRVLEGVRLFLLSFRYGCNALTAVEIVLVSTFFNNFAVVLVGDSYKVFALQKVIGAWQEATVIVVAERFLGVLAMVCIGLMLFVFDTGIFSAVGDVSLNLQIPAVILAIAIATLGLVAGLLLLRRHQQFARLVQSFRSLRAQVGIVQLVAALLLSAVAQVTLAAMVFTLLRGVGTELAFNENLLVMLIVYAAAYIPITVGSLGVREGAIVVGLGWYGVATPVAVSAALVSRVLIYVVALLAGGWWITRRNKR